MKLIFRCGFDLGLWIKKSLYGSCSTHCKRPRISGRSKTRAHSSAVSELAQCTLQENTHSALCTMCHIYSLQGGGRLEWVQWRQGFGCTKQKYQCAFTFITITVVLWLQVSIYTNPLLLNEPLLNPVVSRLAVDTIHCPVSGSKWISCQVMSCLAHPNSMHLILPTHTHCSFSSHLESHITSVSLLLVT